jgi:pimeloyl-ACP methyl ester carboxylesterase
LCQGAEHRDVAVNGVRLHVAEAGAGPPLNLLHGWPQHWWFWRRPTLRLAEDYRVLAPDLRGWGWSDAPRDDYAKATFAADVIALMDAERLDRVSLLGHDWGGYTSCLLSLEHPERIERVIALDVTQPWLGCTRATPRRRCWAPTAGLVDPVPVGAEGRDGPRRRVRRRPAVARVTAPSAAAGRSAVVLPLEQHGGGVVAQLGRRVFDELA